MKVKPTHTAPATGYVCHHTHGHTTTRPQRSHVLSQDARTPAWGNALRSRGADASQPGESRMRENQLEHQTVGDSSSRVPHAAPIHDASTTTTHLRVGKPQLGLDGDKTAGHDSGFDRRCQVVVWVVSDPSLAVATLHIGGVMVSITSLQKTPDPSRDGVLTAGFVITVPSTKCRMACTTRPHSRQRCVWRALAAGNNQTAASPCAFAAVPPPRARPPHTLRRTPPPENPPMTQ